MAWLFKRHTLPVACSANMDRGSCRTAPGQLCRRIVPASPASRAGAVDASSTRHSADVGHGDADLGVASWLPEADSCATNSSAALGDRIPSVLSFRGIRVGVYVLAEARDCSRRPRSEYAHARTCRAVAFTLCLSGDSRFGCAMELTWRSLVYGN